MKNINDYTTFVNQTIKLSDNSNIIPNYNMYKKIISSFLKELKINLYFVSTFGTSLAVLIPVIEKFTKTGIFEIELSTKNIVLLSLCAIAVLTKENKQSVQLLFNKAKENNINSRSIDKLINQLTNFKVIFAIIAQNFNKVITTFSDMLSYTGLLIPFLAVINSLIDKNFIDTDLFIQSLKSIEVTIGSIALKLLIERISKRIGIMLANNHKIQNKENIDILRKHDEFKPEYLKNTNFKID